MGLFFFVFPHDRPWAKPSTPRKPITQLNHAKLRDLLFVSTSRTHKTAMAIKGMNIRKAQSYLGDVVEKKQAVAFRKFTGGVGRHAQGKNVRAPGSQSRWPEKSARILLDLLQNASANAENKGLEVDNLVVSHIQVNQAPLQRRRCYRAHGRINPFMSSPCHVKMILTEKEQAVPKPSNDRQLKKVDK